MTILAPLLLSGAAALAVPLLLHLLPRGESAVRPFPALRYLRRTTRERARALRLRQILLLVVRLGAVTLIVLAGARLVLPVGGRDHPPAGLVLVVDNGISSATVVGERRLLDRRLALARRALARSGPRDRVWIVPAGSPHHPARPLSPDEAERHLAELEPTDVTANLPALIDRGRAILAAAAPPVGQIVVVSDGPSARGRGEERGSDDAAASPPLLVRSGVELPPNRGIADLRLEGPARPRPGDALAVRVEVSGTPATAVTVRLAIDGRAAAVGRTDDDGRVVLALPPLPVGWTTVRAELDPDALRSDDRWHLPIRVAPPPRVATTGSLSPFVMDALAVLEAAGRIEQVSPADAEVVLSDGTSPADPGPSGGGAALVLIAPEAPDRLPALNRTLEGLLPGVGLEPGTRTGRLPVETRDSRIRLPGPPAEAPAYRLVPRDHPSLRILAELADGSPWLVELAGRRPPTLLLASPLRPESGTTAASAAMMPLMDFLTGFPHPEATAQRIVPGQLLPLPPGAGAVRAAGGTLHAVDGTSHFSGTIRAGVYDVLGPEGDTLVRVAANPLPARGGVVAEDPASALVEVAPEAGWERRVLAARRGREVWRPLLAAALLLLLLEGSLTRSAGARPGRDDGPRPP